MSFQCLMAQSINTKAKEAEVIAFLDQYVGHWVGSYELTDMTGKVLQELQAEVDYSWVESEDGPVLKGQAVYGAEGNITIAASETFIDKQSLISITAAEGKQRVYKGTINKEKNTVTWSPLDRPNEIDEAFSETFENDFTGKATLITKGYESVQRDGYEILLTLRSVLYLVELDEAPEPSAE